MTPLKVSACEYIWDDRPRHKQTPRTHCASTPESANAERELVFPASETNESCTAESHPIGPSRSWQMTVIYKERGKKKHNRVNGPRQSRRALQEKAACFKWKHASDYEGEGRSLNRNNW